MSKTKIAVPIAKKTVQEALNQAYKAIDLGADILEIRIDALEDNNNEIINLFKSINFPLIATNRSFKEGGLSKKQYTDRIQLLQQVAPYTDYIDIELNSNEKDIKNIQEFSKNNDKTIIISYHDFQKTPPLEDLIKLVEKSKKYCNNEKDIVKLALMPKENIDTINMMKLMIKYPNGIFISMGELGENTRVIASILESPLVFASIDEKTAPGQIDIKSMQKIINNL